MLAENSIDVWIEKAATIEVVVLDTNPSNPFPAKIVLSNTMEIHLSRRAFNKLIKEFKNQVLLKQ